MEFQFIGSLREETSVNCHTMVQNVGGSSFVFYLFDPYPEVYDSFRVERNVGSHDPWAALRFAHVYCRAAFQAVVRAREKGIRENHKKFLSAQ